MASVPALLAALLLAGAVAAQAQPPERAEPPTTALAGDGMAARHAALAARIAAAPALPFRDGGLCGVQGGAVVRWMRAGAATVRLPVPQSLPGQQPVLLSAVATPPAAATAFRLLAAPGNLVLEVALQGKRADEVRIDWTAVVLLADRPEHAAAEAATSWRAASACAQADAEDVGALADKLGPADQPVATAAARLQQFVREQKPQARPRSLDALGILQSGHNTICTGNANLAVAVLRHRGVPARSLAVVPTNGMRLEMHRIVAWFADGRWQRFDPSSLHGDVPMRAPQSVVMAITTHDDEQRAMQPRMGATLGCPIGQEIEVGDSPVTPWGAEFYWTQAKPLAGFAPDDAALAAAAAGWRRLVESGAVEPAAERAAAAADAAAFAAAWAAR